MRKDMRRVLLERGRTPAHGLDYHLVRKRSLKAAHGDLEDLPEREGMREPYIRGWRCKERGFNAGPMARFLRKNCGRSWDAVFSEICRASRKQSYDRWSSPRDQAEQMVCTNTFDLDGEVWVEATGRNLCECRDYDVRFYDANLGYWVTRPKTVFPIGRSSWKFFVHPVTGILTETKKTPRPANMVRGDPNKLVLDEWNELHKINGIWYAVGFSPFPAEKSLMTGPRRLVLRYSKQVIDMPSTETSLGNMRDALTGERLIDMRVTRHLRWHEWTTGPDGRIRSSVRVRPERFASSKRNLNSRELREHKLKND
jgi:hypothetical protein